MRRAARLAAPLLVAVLLCSLLAQPADAMRRETLTLVTKGGSVVIDIEATETLDEMQRGLMFRTHLAERPACCSPTTGRAR